MHEKPRPEVKISILPTVGGALIALVRDNGEPQITSVKPTTEKLKRDRKLERKIQGEKDRAFHRENHQHNRNLFKWGG